MPIYVTGKLKGYKTRTWSNGRGVSHYIGVAAREFENQWGEKREDVISIEVPQEYGDQAARIASENREQYVRVPIRIIPKEGQRGAWVVYLLEKGGTIEIVRPRPATKNEKAA